MHHAAPKRQEAKETLQACNVPYQVYPVSFSFPAELMLRERHVHKDRVIATVVPGRTETYVHTEQADYYWGYTTALFGLTWKKAGWDCMRHYEIIGSGALPYMPDIADCPHGTLFSFPTDLLKQVLRLPGINHTAIMANQLGNGTELIDEAFDTFQYEKLLNKVLAHARSSMTTVALARYMLETVGIRMDERPKVLFLARDYIDYQAETLFHGLRSLFGKNVVDYPKRQWMYRKPSHADEKAARSVIYGKGFSYAFLLPDLEVDRSQVEEQIRQHHYDLIVYGITNHGYAHLYFLNIVNTVYLKQEVLFVDGSDHGASETHELFSKVCGKQGTCFRRELVCS